MTRLKLFNGTDDEAYESALLNADQHVVDKVLYYRGDPSKRSEMFFMVRFADAEEVLLPWSQDLVGAEQFQQFIFATPELFPLRYNAHAVGSQVTMMRRQPLTGISIGDEFYVDLRFWGHGFYDNLPLPNLYVTRHVVLARYSRLRRKDGGNVQVYVPVFKEYLRDWDYYDVYCFGGQPRLTPEMTLVTEALCVQYQELLPDPPKTKARTVPTRK